MSWSDVEAQIPGAALVIDKHGDKYSIEWYTAPPIAGEWFRAVREDWSVHWPITTRRIFEWSPENPTLVREA